jgi:hypothetical protein
MRKIIAALLVMAISGSTFAQDASSGPEFRKHRFGLQVAPGLAYFTMHDPEPGSKNKSVGYHVSGGLNYEYAFARNFALSTGILFSQTTASINYVDSVNLKWRTNVDGVVVEDIAFKLQSRTYLFNSIDIPMKLKLMTPEIGYLTYFGEFGTTFNIITASFAKKNDVYKNDGDATTTVLSGKAERLDANDETNFLRAAINVGLGAEYNLAGNTSLLIGLNGNFPLNYSLRKKSKSINYIKTDEDFIRETKLNYINLTVGIQF